MSGVAAPASDSLAILLSLASRSSAGLLDLVKHVKDLPPTYTELQRRLAVTQHQLDGINSDIGQLPSLARSKAIETCLTILRSPLQRMELLVRALYSDFETPPSKSLLPLIYEGKSEELERYISSIEMATVELRKILDQTEESVEPQHHHRLSNAELPTPTALVETAPLEEGWDAGTPQNDHPLQTRLVPLASLCRLCEEAMTEISVLSEVQSEAPAVIRLAARLELWSEGVWGAKDRLLDRILDAQPSRHESVRMFVTKSLVNLAVALEAIYRATRNAPSDDTGVPFSSSRRGLLAALRASNLRELASERWTVLAMSYEDVESHLFEVADQDLTILPARESTASWPQNSGMNAQVVSLALQDIDIVLESLLSINSSIRSIRHSYRLDSEANPPKQLHTAGPLAAGSMAGDVHRATTSKDPWLNEPQDDISPAALSPFPGIQPLSIPDLTPKGKLSRTSAPLSHSRMHSSSRTSLLHEPAVFQSPNTSGPKLVHNLDHSPFPYPQFYTIPAPRESSDLRYYDASGFNSELTKTTATLSTGKRTAVDGSNESSSKETEKAQQRAEERLMAFYMDRGP